MTNEDVAVALKGLEHEVGSLKHRMSAVEREQEALTKLASAVEVMAAEQRNQSETMKTIQKDVTALGGKVDTLEKKPGRRWDSASAAILTAVLTTLVCFLLRQIGIF